jgi:hypothetical protein
MRDASGKTVIVPTPGSVPASPLDPGTYDFSIAIRRIAKGALEIRWSLVKTSGEGYTTSGSFTDESPVTYVFDRVGMLGGKSLNAQTISYKGVTVTISSITTT